MNFQIFKEWNGVHEFPDEDMEKQTGSETGKEYVKAVYCHPAYDITKELYR